MICSITQKKKSWNHYTGKVFFPLMNDVVMIRACLLFGSEYSGYYLESRVDLWPFSRSLKAAEVRLHGCFWPSFITYCPQLELCIHTWWTWQKISGLEEHGSTLIRPLVCTHTPLSLITYPDFDLAVVVLLFFTGIPQRSIKFHMKIHVESCSSVCRCSYRYRVKEVTHFASLLWRQLNLTSVILDLCNRTDTSVSIRPPEASQALSGTFITSTILLYGNIHTRAQGK